MKGVIKAVTDAGLPPELSHLYTVVLPKGVEVCFDQSNSAQGGSCTTSNAEAGYGFCAYHSSGLGTSYPQLSYAVLPYPAVDSPTGISCNVGHESPSKNPDLDVSISAYSHELAEAVTDPTGDGWHDAEGNENGDLCSSAFGALSGKAGKRYN